MRWNRCWKNSVSPAAASARGCHHHARSRSPVYSGTADRPLCRAQRRQRHSQCLGDSRRHSRHGREGAGRLGELFRPHAPGTGERHIGAPLARLDAEAVHLRAGVRPGHPASADGVARRTHVVRTLYAGEFRRAVSGPDHGNGRAQPQPQHSCRLGRVAAAFARSVPISAGSGNRASGERTALRPGAGARRRRSQHAGACRPLCDARQSRPAEAVAVARRRRAGGRHAAPECRSELHGDGHAAPACPPG